MPESRNLDNGQRLFSVKDLPSNITIEKAYKDAEGNVCVMFQPCLLYTSDAADE